MGYCSGKNNVINIKITPYLPPSDEKQNTAMLKIDYNCIIQETSSSFLKVGVLNEQRFKRSFLDKLEETLLHIKNT
jgi:hypothetical protein